MLHSLPPLLYCNLAPSNPPPTNFMVFPTRISAPRGQGSLPLLFTAVFSAVIPGWTYFREDRECRLRDRLQNLAATLATPSSRPHLGEETSRTSPAPRPAHARLPPEQRSWRIGWLGLDFWNCVRLVTSAASALAERVTSRRRGTELPTACGATCLSEWGPILGCSRPRLLIVSLRENQSGFWLW